MRNLLDKDGENRAVRMFLALYGGNPGVTVEQMRKHLTLLGYELWPAWASDLTPHGHLTKGGAQDWLRYLFALEQPADELTNEQITAGAAVLGDDGKPIGRNTAIMVADAMRIEQPGEERKEADESDRLFVLLTEIRAACGDNGQREQDELVAYIAEQARDAERMDFVEMHCLLSLDSVTGEPGGNGQKLVAASRGNIDAELAEKGERK